MAGFEVSTEAEGGKTDAEESAYGGAAYDGTPAGGDGTPVEEIRGSSE